MQLNVATLEELASGSATRMKICLVNLNSYPALVPGLSEHAIGGAEVQQAMLARMLAERGWDVRVVTGDWGQPDGTVVDGVSVFRCYRQGAGVPGLRFFYPRWFKLNAALRRADADIYYVSCAGTLVGQVVWFARRRGRKVVFRVASDSDCVPEHLLISGTKDRWFYEYGLRRAQAIVVQTTHQQTLLRRHYGLESSLVPSLVEVPGQVPSLTHRDIDVLWIANLRALKRAEIFIELARALPRYCFHLVGGAVEAEAKVARRVQDAAASVPNLTLHGRLGLRESLALFDRAKLLVNTSEIEGFPTSFLQAWARATPTVSFLDPDQMIEQEGLGARVNDRQALIQAVDRLLSDQNEMTAAARRCRVLMEERFGHDAVLAPYEELFQQVAAA